VRVYKYLYRPNSVILNKRNDTFNCGVVLEFAILFVCQRLNTATSLPADDVHHYVIPQKLLDSVFNKLPVFMLQLEKEKAVLYPVEAPPQ
jgi:hypothetical protein